MLEEAILDTYDEALARVTASADTAAAAASAARAAAAAQARCAAVGSAAMAARDQLARSNVSGAAVVGVSGAAGAVVPAFANSSGGRRAVEGGKAIHSFVAAIKERIDATNGGSNGFNGGATSSEEAAAVEAAAEAAVAAAGEARAALVVAQAAAAKALEGERSVGTAAFDARVNKALAAKLQLRSGLTEGTRAGDAVHKLVVQIVEFTLASAFSAAQERRLRTCSCPVLLPCAPALCSCLAYSFSPPRVASEEARARVCLTCAPWSMHPSD